MSSSDRASKMLEGLKQKTREGTRDKFVDKPKEKTSTPKCSSQTATATSIVQSDPRGRKKRADSKRSRLASGELSKLSVLIPAELHTALSVMAAKDKSKDVSDIVTAILQKNVKT